MAGPFAIIKQSLQENLPEVRSRSWRASLRARLSADAMHEILASFAEGKAWMAELPDGRCSAPMIPSSDVRLRAIMFLHEALYGKAVAQTEIQKAEQEAKEFEAVRALSDDELELEAAKVLEARRVEKLTAGTVYTEYTVDPEPETEGKDLSVPELALRIWASPHSEDDP